MGLKPVCQGMCITRSHAIWFSERGVISSQRPGIFFRVCFCWNWKTVWRNTLEFLPQSLITTTPQVNQELPCWQNYEEDEGGKSGQDKYRGGNFCNSEVRRYWWEDQGEKKHKYEEGDGWLVLFITNCFCPCIFSILSTKKPPSIISGIRLASLVEDWAGACARFIEIDLTESAFKEPSENISGDLKLQERIIDTASCAYIVLPSNRHIHIGWADIWYNLIKKYPRA